MASKSPTIALGTGARATLLSLCFLACFAGCQGGDEATEPPLRPLLYTQGNEAEEQVIPGYEPWQNEGFDPIAWPPLLSEGNAEASFEEQQHFDISTPEGTIRAAFSAATRGDEDTLRSLMLGPEELEEFAQYSPAGAQRRAQELEAGTREFIRAFRDASPADRRDEGLSSILQSADILVGAPRLVTGEIVDERAQATMHSTNALRVHILGTNIDFDVRFPRLIRGPEGNWYIAEPPSVSATWERFRTPGLDLKPELLRSENTPIPFEVGNYWQFEVGRLNTAPAQHIEDGEGSTEQEPGAAEADPQEDAIERWSPQRDLAFRDTISDVHDGGNYLVVSIRRTYADRRRTPETEHLLVTPRHIYPCSRTCFRDRSNITNLLNYMNDTVPLWVFPLRDERVWGPGGVDGRASARTTTAEREGIEVPAGNYAPAWTSRELRAQGIDRVTISPGIGPVRILRSQPEGIFDARLSDYRILR